MILIPIAAVVVGVVVGLWVRGSLTLAADDAWNQDVFEGFDMITRGVQVGDLTRIAKDLDMEIVNLREANKKGDGWAFRIAPAASDSKFARRSPSGRRGRWVCYHGFYEFIEACWAAGMYSLNTVGPKGKRKTYRSPAEFEQDLDAFYERQVGAPAFPVWFGELCDHERGEEVA